jgi:hypothetical protein
VPTAILFPKEFNNSKLIITFAREIYAIMKINVFCPIVLFMSILLLSTCSNEHDKYDDIPPSPPVKCVVLGNSITTHPICSYWWGEWGMAASTRNKDFIHKLESKFKFRKLNYSFTPVNIANWERSLDIDTLNLFALRIYDYNIIIIRLGENIRDDIDSVDCENALKELVSSIKKINRSAIIYITGVFWPNATKETAIINVASSEKIKYINIDKYYTDSYLQEIGNQVYGDDGQYHVINNKGVANHPNDSGMSVIAEELYKAISPTIRKHVFNFRGQSDVDP